MLNINQKQLKKELEQEGQSEENIQNLVVRDKKRWGKNERGKMLVGYNRQTHHGLRTIVQSV